MVFQSLNFWATIGVQDSQRERDGVRRWHARAIAIVCDVEFDRILTRRRKIGRPREDLSFRIVFRARRERAMAVLQIGKETFEVYEEVLANEKWIVRGHREFGIEGSNT